MEGDSEFYTVFCINYLVMTICNEECTPDSITKFGFDVNN